MLCPRCSKKGGNGVFYFALTLRAGFVVMATDPGWEDWARGDPILKKAHKKMEENRKREAKAAGIRFEPKPYDGMDNPNGVNDGWNAKKVMAGVRAIAELEDFTPAQHADWDALFGFHEQYTSADSIPSEQMQLKTSDGRVLNMEGPPDWNELWRVLRRFPRAHRKDAQPSASAPPPPPPPPPAPIGNLVAVTMPDGKVAMLPLAASDALTLNNRVGGINNTKAAVSKSKKLAQQAQDVMRLDSARPESQIEVGKLYFARIQKSEGELLVGLCTPYGPFEDIPDPDDNDGVRTVRACPVAWFIRKPWSSKPTAKAYKWSSNPVFIPSLYSELVEDDENRSKKSKATYVKRVQANLEPQSSFLPVDVAQTESSIFDSNIPMVEGSHRVKLSQPGVNLLRKFVAERAPELVDPAPAAAGALSLCGACDVSEAESDHGESDEESDGAEDDKVDKLLNDDDSLSDASSDAQSCDNSSRSPAQTMALARSIAAETSSSPPRPPQAPASTDALVEQVQGQFEKMTSPSGVVRKRPVRNVPKHVYR